MVVAPWIYQGAPFVDPGNYWGFVYLITHISTQQKYVGKKFFTKSKIRQVKGKKKKSRVESDWQTYFGSSIRVQEAVKQCGESEFTREILHLCTTKAECSYFESFEIFSRHALISPRYYNDWVSCKIRKSHLKHLFPF